MIFIIRPSYKSENWNHSFAKINNFLWLIYYYIQIEVSKAINHFDANSITDSFQSANFRWVTGGTSAIYYILYRLWEGEWKNDKNVYLTSR